MSATSALADNESANAHTIAALVFVIRALILLLTAASRFSELVFVSPLERVAA
jgi:hypothetical protein